MADVEELSMVVDRAIALLKSPDVKKTALLLGVADKDFDFLTNEISDLKKLVGEGKGDLLHRHARAVFAADDIADGLSTLMAIKVGSFFSPKDPFVRKIRDEIGKFGKLLDQAEGQPGGFPGEIGAPRETHMCVSEEEVLGRDAEKRKILEFVIPKEASNRLTVIPIFGVQGIGKTTLAKLVFNDDAVREHFAVKMWVRIADVINVRLIAGKLIQAADKGADVNLHMDQLQKKLREEISGKRFLLVLDGVREKSSENWVSLNNLLLWASGIKGNVVLVTTRSENVADIMRTVPSDQNWPLSRLSEEASWLLFKRQSGLEQDRGRDQSKWEEIGKRAAKKCNGVPLVVCHVAGSLKSKGLDKWLRLLHSDTLFAKAIKECITPEEKHERKTKPVTGDMKEQSQPFISLEDVVGREDERQYMVGKLLDPNSKEDVVIIPIVGTAGVGKTAFAQLVFNDERVQLHFDLRIWVTVGKDFDLKVILQKILASVPGETSQGGDLKQLQQLFFQGVLRGNRYFLVLDDVREENRQKWSDLKACLSFGANESRVVVTTRSKTVGILSQNTGSHAFDLGGLDKEKSWSLLKKFALVNRKEPTDHTEFTEIGEKIVKECRGNPLMIRTIAIVLFHKEKKEEWQTFYADELSEMLEDEDSILAPLKLSYDHLPSHLKYPFSVCLLFPKDYEIDVQTLVYVWVSLGITDPHQDRNNPEDLGYRWFIELLQISFFQETERDEWGNVTKFKTPSSFYDVATLVAAENAFATLHMNTEYNYETDPRHASFNFHPDFTWQIPTSLAKVERLRTLILNRQSRWDVEGSPGDSVCAAITKHRSLRMLDLHNLGIKALPSSIGELKHLRYLDLSRNVNLEELPRSITGLWNLQTLKLNKCSNLRALPSDIGKLVKLRNLENELCYSLTHMPQGLSQLSNLRSLPEFVLSKGASDAASKRAGKLDVLKNLKNLSGRLQIKNLRLPVDDKTKEALLKDKSRLSSLALIWDVDAAIDATHYEKSLEDLEPPKDLRELSVSCYGGASFPKWLESHTQLVKLELLKCGKCEYLPELDSLPSLQVLVVDELAELTCISKEEEVSVSEPAVFFPSLKELHLTNLPKLVRWSTSGNHQTFPRLSKLIIKDCPNLMSMPVFPTVDELLVLKNTKWEPFKQTINWSQPSSSTSSSSEASLSKLRTLRIVSMSGSDPVMLQSLHSLRNLTLDHLPEVGTDFLRKLKGVSSLQELHIWRCDGLKEISRWIKGIKSLKILSMKLCPNLSIPSYQISLIFSLRRVEIENCPLASHIECMLKDRLYTRNRTGYAGSGPN